VGSVLMGRWNPVFQPNARSPQCGSEIRTGESVLNNLTAFIRALRIYAPLEYLALHLPGKVSSEEALQLLESALALHGYSLLRQDKNVWIVSVEQAASIEVGPLDYADAGELAWTLALRCADYAQEKPVAFSCKRRGFCPSCGARRMAETTRGWAT
jgi:hypothetical protein